MWQRSGQQETVPCSWASNGERLIADCWSTCSWHDEIGRWRRLHATTDSAADGHCQLCQVSWRCSVEAMIHEHGQFVACVCCATPSYWRIKQSERDGVSGTTGGEREDWETLYQLFLLPSKSHCFSLSVLIATCMQTYRPTTQRTSCCWPRPNLAMRVNRVSQAAYEHRAGNSNLLSVTRQRLINERLWTHY